MQRKRILLLGGNYFPEPTGIGKYNSEMLDWLSLQGHECGVVTTYPYYPYWKVQAPYTAKARWYSKEKRMVLGGTPIQMYRCPHYVPAVPTGIRRVLSDLSFFLSSFFQVFILLFKKRYDYVICVAPPFQIGVLGLLYKWIRGAKFLYHVQDLQIDAANELGMIKSKLLLRVMFGIERFIIRKATVVSSISEGMIRKIEAKCNREILLFPNWVDVDIFFPISEKEELKQAFNFKLTDKIVLYSGAIGEKQGLQDLLLSANALRQFDDIKFVICGSGPYKNRLIELVDELKLRNVIFFPLQPKEKFNQFLNMADVHLVLQKSNANDLVMPSKLTTILSIGGLAVVTAEPDTTLHALVTAHRMGILTKPENESSLTSSICAALELSCEEIKENARCYAENHLNIDRVVGNFFEKIEGKQKQTGVLRTLLYKRYAGTAR